MDQKRYIDTRKITARRKAEFTRACKEAPTKRQIYTLAVELATETKAKTDLEGTVKGLARALYSCGLAAWYMEHANSVEEYVIAYILWKLRIYTELNDTGALGDAIEMIVHLLAARKNWRTKIDNLHVTRIRDTDVRIGGIRFEVGHNAKLWADSSMEDAMKGPFTGVIYGMLENEEIEQIAKVMASDFRRGVTELADMLYVFTDKYEYLNIMQHDLGRSETIKYRKDLNQMITVYNPSKHRAWIKRMEGSEFQTLAEYMKSLGENDYLK